MMSPSLPLWLQVVYYEIETISSLSFKELVSIVATYKSMSEEETDFEARGYTAKQIETMKLHHKATPTTSVGLRFTRSLRDFPCQNFGFYSTTFAQYDSHGTLPFEGSLSDQPNFIIEVFNTLKNLVLESQIQAQKAQEKRRT